MGQRLIITVKEQGKPLCMIYQHWSAYTIDSLWSVKEFGDMYFSDKFKDIQDKLLRIVTMYETIGGGVCDSDRKIFHDRYNHFCRSDVDRNVGIIAFTEHAMKELYVYGEGFLEISLDDDGLIINDRWIDEFIFRTELASYDEPFYDEPLPKFTDIDSDDILGHPFGYFNIDEMISFAEKLPARIGDFIYWAS